MCRLFLITLLFSQFAVASSVSDQSKFWVEAEASAVWQGKNEVQIPDNTGTRFSIADLENGANFAGRIYLGYRLSEKHELRALYAPLTIDLNGSSGQSISFQNQVFAANSPLKARYKFNSYRLTYRYIFKENDRWTLRIGFTGKIRDAQIRLAQGALSAERSNVGFVPLLHFSAVYDAGEHFRFHFDADALAAPQGRAEDVAILVGYKNKPTSPIEYRIGYRTVEGGADGGGDVYNFAWLHYAVAGIHYFF